MTDACFDRNTFTTCSDPDRYLFWDSVHPTERGHALIAGDFYSTTVPEPSTITLMSVVVLIGFSFRAQSIRRHEI